jgi:CPA1 family monovalent cation:H+ antiporter
MTVPEIAAILVSLAALLSYLNHRLLRLPTTIGLMVLAMGLSLAVLAAGLVVPAIPMAARTLLSHVDFSATLMHGMLGFLLFAGALHVDLGDLAEQRRVVLLLATVGVVISTGLVAALTWLVSGWLGLGLAPVHCMLFGALISPTDPIAVLGLLKKLGAPRSLATKIAGESLLNDGVGVVLYLALLGLAGLGDGHGPVTALAVGRLLVVEVLGGAAFGLAIGWVVYRMLRSVDSYQVEILLSLALVSGGYALAEAIHVSAPIAMVVSGLLIGNHGRAFAMSERTRVHLDTFWELVDEILNAVLFVLIGLEVMVLHVSGRSLAAGMLAVPVVVLARFIAVGAPVTVLRSVRRFTPHAVKALTWSGLRGGISVALALALARQLGDAQTVVRDTMLVMTYSVVVFSIVVQGLTVSPLLRRWGLTAAPSAGQATGPP